MRSQQTACVQAAEHQLSHAGGGSQGCRQARSGSRQTSTALGARNERTTHRILMKRAMRDLWYLVRFFYVVPPVSSLMAGTFGALTVAAAVAIMSDTRRAPGALMPILVLQTFAASSGFSLPARRGNYDLPLTRTSTRTLSALVPWAAS